MYNSTLNVVVHPVTCSAEHIKSRDIYDVSLGTFRYLCLSRPLRDGVYSLSNILLNKCVMSLDLSGS